MMIYRIIFMSIILIGCQTDSAYINFPVGKETDSDTRPGAIVKERLGDCTVTVKKGNTSPEVECEKY